MRRTSDQPYEDDDSYVVELELKAEQLRLEMVEAEKAEEKARSRVDKHADFIERAEKNVQTAKDAVAIFETTKSSAKAEEARARAEVEDAESAVEEARKKLKALGSEVDVSDGGGSAPTSGSSSTEASASALRKLSDRDLNEVRRLPNPPVLVRRALELVQAMLACNDGGGAADVSSGGGGAEGAGSSVPWSELRDMLGRADFLKRVAAISPLTLSHRPKLLQQIDERWPSLREAGGGGAAAAPAAAAPAPAAAPAGAEAGSKAAPSSSSSSAAPQPPLAAREGNKPTPANRSAVAGKWKAAAQQARGGGGVEGSGAGGGGGRPSRLRAALEAAVVAEGGSLGGGGARGEGVAMTAEAVEYASKPMGAIFRFCAACVSAARRLAAERKEMQARLDELERVLGGKQSALAATVEHGSKLEAEAAKLAAAVVAAEAALAKVVDGRLDEKVTHAAAVKALEAARAAAEAARLKAERERAAWERRRDENAARRERDEALAKAAKERLQHVDVSLNLEKERRERLVWIDEKSLDKACTLPIEFGAGQAANLPPSATLNVLPKLARALQQQACLKLHIAGHVGQDEDPKIASLRAQAVGGALIALGVRPLRLRAKGYGSSVAISRPARLALKLKSERRVTLHALSEVRTQFPCEFDAKSAEVSDSANRLMIAVAKLLEASPKLRLSIEAHTDDVGAPEDNAKLSTARAAAIVHTLDMLGVDPTRLTPHGFGAAFPCDDNATGAGRQRNRRVEFLVIPDVADLGLPASVARVS